MTQIDRLAAEIREYCEAHADAKKAAKHTRYFKEGYHARGIIDRDDPFWNARRDEWLQKNAKLGLAGFLKLGNVLFSSGKYEEGGAGDPLCEALSRRHRLRGRGPRKARN